MRPTLQTLPLEIITMIFTHLPISSLPACLRTSRFIHSAIKESLELQYALEKDKAGVEDNRFDRSKPSISEKLNLLKEREDAWKTFNYKFMRELEGFELPKSDMFNVIADTIFVGRDDPRNPKLTSALKFARLPVDSEEPMAWETLDVGKSIITFGAALEEHDLIALACYRSPSREGIDIILRRLSTQSKHPYAQKNIIPVCNLELEQLLADVNVEDIKPWVSIDICGENLIICVECYNLEPLMKSIYILNWKTGEMKFKPIKDMNCPNVIFLRHDIFVKMQFTNDRPFSEVIMETYHLPQSPLTGEDDLIPFVHLGFPELREYVEVTGTRCRGDPSPKDPLSIRPLGSQYGLSQQRPFCNRAEDSLLITYSFVMHRDKLLDIVQPYLPPVTNSFPAHRTDPTSTTSAQIPSTHLVTDNGSEDSAGSDTDDEMLTEDSVSEIEVPLLSWSQWGPHNTRWIENGHGDFFRDIYPTSGGRFVIPYPQADDVQRYLYWDILQVMDFGKGRVRDAIATWRNDGTSSGQEENGNWELVTAPTVLNQNENNPFNETIRSYLPYTHTISKEEFRICAQFLDEERVMFLGEENSCSMLYFG
ncbi:hypothetical protein BDQ17DRAFT_1374286 [Cyathus striatus]|nr:hypothetical protein BDQ17DRAFT_1374286 [Cyathus striatus]